MKKQLEGNLSFHVTKRKQNKKLSCPALYHKDMCIVCFLFLFFSFNIY